MYYRQPRYFGGFKCLGGACTNTCCVGWRIDWKKEEIDKVANAPNCSPELKELVEKSFEKQENSDKYAVALDNKKRCPLLTEDNFCRVQRELGEEYLSDTCKIYPRHHSILGNTVYRYCSMSCPEIMRNLLNDEKSMDLVNIKVTQETTVRVSKLNTPEMLQKHPEIKYCAELREFFYEIIADKKHDIETSIILGALTAQSISKLVENGDYDRIPEAIKQIKPQLHNGAQLKSIENIKPNYYIKLGVLGELLKNLLDMNVMMALIDNEGRPNIDLYLQGEERLANTFADRPFYLRNIALNMFLSFDMPFKLRDNTIFENYSIFVTALALFKLNVIATAELTERVDDKEIHSNRENTEKYINKSATLISRKLCHNDLNLKDLLGELKRHNFTSPAYLALLIK